MVRRAKIERAWSDIDESRRRSGVSGMRYKLTRAGIVAVPEFDRSVDPTRLLP